MQLRPAPFAPPLRHPFVVAAATLVVLIAWLPPDAGAKTRRRRGKAPAAAQKKGSDSNSSSDSDRALEEAAGITGHGDAPAGGDETDEAGQAEQADQADQADETEESDENSAMPRKSAAGPSARVSSEVSGYGDSDAVFVLSPSISGSIADDVAGWSVSGSYLVDAVSAASVDIVSTASGHWTELRHVGAASADFKARGAAVSLAGNLSREPDYLSLGGGAVVSLELLDKNLTPFLGGSVGHDLVGRHGDPQSIWPVLNKGNLKAGATIIVNASTIAALSLDAIFERGYLAKPYRYLPIVAPGTAAMIPAGASVDLVKSMNQFSVSENLPAARDRYALSGRLAHRWDRTTFRGDERLYVDTWGLRASTTDVHQFIDLGARVVVWPHLRAHAQNGVSFWRRIFEQVPNPAGGAPGIPAYRSGDRELGPLYTITAGLGTSIRLNSDRRAPWSLKLQLDSINTRYLDALYITSRTAWFSTLSVEAALN